MLSTAFLIDLPVETQIAGGSIADKQKIFKICLNSTLFLLASDVPTPLDLVRKIRWAKVLGHLSYLTFMASSRLHSWKSSWKFWKPSYFSKGKRLVHHSEHTFPNFYLISVFPIVHQYPVKLPHREAWLPPIRELRFKMAFLVTVSLCPEVSVGNSVGCLFCFHLSINHSYS